MSSRRTPHPDMPGDSGERIIGDPGEGWLAILGSRRRFTPHAVKWFIGFCEGYWEIEPDGILMLEPTYMQETDEPGWWEFCEKSDPGAIPATKALLKQEMAWGDGLVTL